jgi:hypothetical protein
MMARKKGSKRRAAAKPKKRTKGTASRARSKSRSARKAQAKKSTARKTARRSPITRRTDRAERRGLGLEAGGQSGDIEGLSRAEVADSESVEELVEEGQAFEAGIVEGVENVPDADRGPIRTREVPEDDVPEEYLDED